MTTQEGKNKIPPFESVKVLIADDDKPTRMLLQAAISQWGYNVLEAADGVEAWKILQESKPSLLILDWLMPNLDGLALCQRIRNELDYYPYVIFLTQLSGTTNIIKGFEAGADEFLLKPIEPSDLHIRLLAGEKVINYLSIIAEQKTRIKELESLIETMKKNYA